MKEVPSQKSSASPSSDERSSWAAVGLGAQFFAAILFFVYVGSWADRRWHTAPIFLLVGLFGGGGGSFYLGVRRLMAPPAARSPHGTDVSEKP